MDSIASSHMIPTDNDNDLVKTGTGTVVVNGDMSRYYGALTVDAGKFQINSDLSGAAFDTTTVNGRRTGAQGQLFFKRDDSSGADCKRSNDECVRFVSRRTNVFSWHNQCCFGRK